MENELNEILKLIDKKNCALSAFVLGFALGISIMAVLFNIING